MIFDNIMKRAFIVTVFAFSCIAAGAQTMYDGINYCENNYYGTARSMAMGNAMTAVGGDPGSFGINPAGSAVSGYSQFTISPGLTISSTSASYAPAARGPFTSTADESQARFTVPNCGVSINVDTGNNFGLKNYSFGFTANTTNVYHDCMSAGGVNSVTSMMGESAFYCSGIKSSLLGSNNAYFDTDYSWQDILAYKSGMISTYGEDGESYIGSTELLYDDGSIGLGGPINQSYYRRHLGSKTDLLFNFAFNFNDKFYVGANIGVPSLSYSEAINKTESAVDPNDFAMKIDDIETAFISGRQRYTIDADGTGIYSKLGFIWLPFKGLRIGGAIKTPTIYTITEKWMWDAVCDFRNIRSDLCETPVGEFTYDLISPFSFNVGAAYTLADRALLSFDWERTDFRSMQFRDTDYEYGFAMNSFSDLNREIRKYAGVTDNLRVGLEAKVIPEFALRAGYSFKQYYEADYCCDKTSTYSLGCGYSSPGSFFADLAVRYSKYPDNWFYPYDDYLEDTRSPEINVVKNMMDVVLTVGWRF